MPVIIPDIPMKTAGLVILEHEPDSTVLAFLFVCFYLGSCFEDPLVGEVMEINLLCISSVVLWLFLHPACAGSHTNPQPSSLP